MEEETALPPEFVDSKKKPNMAKSTTEKEIVSALVRLNTQGLKVPIKIEEIKKLPIIP